MYCGGEDDDDGGGCCCGCADYLLESRRLCHRKRIYHHELDSVLEHFCVPLEAFSLCCYYDFDYDCDDDNHYHHHHHHHLGDSS